MLELDIDEIVTVIFMAKGLQDGETIRSSEGLGWGSPDMTIKRDGNSIRVYPGYGILSSAIYTIKQEGSKFHVCEGLGILGSCIYTIKQEGNKMRVYEGLGILGSCIRTITKG